MRCFFHLIGEKEAIIDDDGVIVDDLEQARREAIRSITELLEDSIESGADWSGWRIDICDQSGRSYAVVYFDAFRTPEAARATGQ